MEAGCSAFQLTGAHAWAKDQTPTFLCRGPGAWAGYMEHCIGIIRIVDRHGQRDDECGVSRFPDSGCIVCGRDGEWLCDQPRCDVPLCDLHRTTAIGSGVDKCPVHA